MGLKFRGLRFRVYRARGLALRLGRTTWRRFASEDVAPILGGATTEADSPKPYSSKKEAAMNVNNSRKPLPLGS